MLTLDRPRVLPWNSLGVSRVLAEPVCYPRITLEVLLQPVHVLSLFLKSGEGCLTKFKDLVSLSACLPELLVHLVVEDRLSEQLVRRSVKLAWHPLLCCVLVCKLVLDLVKGSRPFLLVII